MKTAAADVEHPTRKPRILRAKQRTEATIERITSDARNLSSDAEPATALPVQSAEAGPKATISGSFVPHTVPSPTPARPARTRGRHRFLTLSFVLFFVTPVTLAGYYLWTFAADQYASNLAFSVRSEEQGSAVELLGGVTELSGSSTVDTDILFAYLTSQELVSKVNDRLDLAQMWSKVTVNNDPLFAYDPTGTIEDLLAHWQRKISIIYDSATRLIDVRVLAFDPADAQAVAQAIVEESTALINALSDTARDDAINYARDELTVTSDRLKEARQALTLFRNRTQIVDPDIDTRNQMGVLVTRQRQLAEALIDFDLLQDTTRSGDPRIAQATRRVDVIQKRIDAERRKLGLGAGAQEGVVFADLVGEYEGLMVDREFAEAAYTSALATHDAALAEARRQSRYLAAHIRPTLAQQAEYPERLKMLLLVALCSFLGWSILSLVFYSLRDRR
ncbi:MAG: capsule biosynthesis protein [Tateyamaria sp.]